MQVLKYNEVVVKDFLALINFYCIFYTPNKHKHKKLLFQFNALFLGESVITEEKKKAVFEAFGWLNSFLSKTKYVASDKPTIADLSIIATISGLIVS